MVLKTTIFDERSGPNSLGSKLFVCAPLSEDVMATMAINKRIENRNLEIIWCGSLSIQNARCFLTCKFHSNPVRFDNFAGLKIPTRQILSAGRFERVRHDFTHNLAGCLLVPIECYQNRPSNFGLVDEIGLGTRIVTVSVPKPPETMICVNLVADAPVYSLALRPLRRLCVCF